MRYSLELRTDGADSARSVQSQARESGDALGVLLPSPDPQRWIEELARWPLDWERVRLYLVPRSLRDRDCVAAFVITNGSSEARPGAWTVPHQSRAGRVYFPWDCHWSAPLQDSELDRSFPDGIVLCHPTQGWTCFDEADALRPEQLLLKPARRRSAWRAVDPGVREASRLREVRPLALPSVSEFLDAGGNDMESGDDSQTLDQSPEEYDAESQKGLNSWVQHGVANTVHWFTSRAPEGATKPTWVDRIHDWAQDKLDQRQRRDDVLRNKEIFRLLHLLETNPDRGLRHALPLQSLGTRGVAPPGVELGDREIDFNLEQLQGGKPGAPWDISGEVWHRLSEMYRELATRELQLGRHRRAAYIFAQLLGDFRQAALVLFQGKWFREAGVLFRDHLQEPREAARCFEAQGDLWEAIALYEEEKCYLEAGHLYSRLRELEKARHAYGKAATALRAQGDFVGSAKILRDLLQSRDEALAALRSGWPDSVQARECLQLELELLADGQVSTALQQRLRGLSLERLAPDRKGDALDIVAGWSQRAVDPTVAEVARDVAFELAAEQLSVASEHNWRATKAVSDLFPDDPFLVRDASRYVDALRERLRQQRAREARQALDVRRARPDRKGPVQMEAMLWLRPGVQWFAARPTLGGFLVAGRSGSQVVVVRIGSFPPEGVVRAQRQGRVGSGEPSQHLRPKAGAAVEWAGSQAEVPEDGCVEWQLTTTPERFVFAASSHEPSVAILHGIGGARLGGQTLPGSDGCVSETRIGALPWLPSDLWSAEIAADGTIWTVHGADLQPVLSCFRADGQLVESRDLRVTLDPALPVSLHARHEMVFLANGQNLWRIVGDEVHGSLLLDDVWGLVGSAPFTATRIAATFSQGGSLVWAGLGWEHQYPFAVGLSEPQATLLRDGRLVAAAAGQGQIYDTGNRRITLRTEFEVHDKPLAVLPQARANGFVVVSTSGRVTWYKTEGGE